MTGTKHRYANIDFETTSAADLRRTGVYVYAAHPTTRVICLAYSFEKGPVQLWVFGQPAPQELLDHVAAGRRVRGWNIGFEIEIWNKVFLPQIGADRYINLLVASQCNDTMAQAAYYGLPLSLDQASAAAGTGFLKDKEGHALMLRMARPRSKARDGTMTWWHEDDRGKLLQLCQYCVRDVKAERAIAELLPPLPDAERRIWLLDHRINERGVGFDVASIERLMAVADGAKAKLNWDMNALTNGEVRSLNSNTALLAWLQARGYPEDNIRKDVVAARLAHPACTGSERAALTIRAEGAKTSAAKLSTMLEAMLPHSAADRSVGVIRGMLQHYGAFRTGRWAGRLVQPQNLPRPELDRSVIEMFLEAIAHTTDVGVLECLFGGAMAAVASSLRGVIIARPGKKLAVADFSQIEARVVAWLAGERKVLGAFVRADNDPGAPDVYEIAAAGIYGVRPEDVTKAQRQIGKVAVLALGYGGGKGAFQIMAAAYGVDMTDDEAEAIKVAWRAANPYIVRFWYDLEGACADVIRSGGMREVGCLRVGMVGRALVIRLPSGRGLFYREAALRPDDQGRVGITYMGLNQYTRKWERLRTYGGKLVENVTQAVARDCMAHVMLEADARGHHTILTVHDELLTEPDAAVADERLADLLALMARPIPWAPGLPTVGDGWAGHRYRK